MKTTPRLRLQLRRYVYYYRWELLGTYSRWHKGSGTRIETVERALNHVRYALPLGD